jgi:hypothetical protein
VHAKEETMPTNANQGRRKQTTRARPHGKVGGNRVRSKRGAEATGRGAGRSGGARNRTLRSPQKDRNRARVGRTDSPRGAKSNLRRSRSSGVRGLARGRGRARAGGR